MLVVDASRGFVTVSAFRFETKVAMAFRDDVRSLRISCVTSSGFRVNVEAEIITNSILGAPCYNYSIIIGPPNQNPILIIKGPTILGAQVLAYKYVIT